MADVSEAVEFMRQYNDAESSNRTEAITALKFRYGDQWPQYAIDSRGLDRPQLTINDTNTLIKKVTNAQRQQRPRGKASPVDQFADKKIAKVITGLLRHFEVNSDADYAYDTAFDFSATMGWGYFRVMADYISEDSFDQDVYFCGIDNPFTVCFDPSSKLPDGSDAEKALVTDLMRKEVFKITYPDATMANFEEMANSDPEWVTEQDIRLAEYFYVDRTRAKLVMLSDGTPVWANQLPPKELLEKAGIRILGMRDSFKRIVKYQKQTALEILEEKTLPGRWIPIVPVYWTNTVIDGKRLRQGMVKDMMDPARMNNFWKTAITEYLALSPKAKWLGYEGFDEGHEKEFAGANLSASPTLRVKSTGVDGQPIPLPTRLQPEPPPSGLIEATFMATQDLSRVAGVFDPAVRGGAQHKSDKTLNAEQGQSENTNFEGFDNLTRSMKHGYRIALSYVPAIMDVQSVRRIIGEDGREELITVNEKAPQIDPQTGQPQVDEAGQAIMTVLNDVRVGTYDVVMETGPSFNTKQQEGVEAMLQLMNTPVGEKIAAAGDDLLVRQMDFYGADVLADRLAAANPLSQIDDKSPISPAVQMKLKGMGQMIQKLQGALQQMELEKKYGIASAEVKEHGAILREKMKQAGEAEDREITRAQKAHDTEMYSLTAQHVAEINALAKILTSHSDAGHRLREILLEFQHEQEMLDTSEEHKANQVEPEQRQPAAGSNGANP